MSRREVGVRRRQYDRGRDDWNTGDRNDSATDSPYQPHNAAPANPCICKLDRMRERAESEWIEVKEERRIGVRWVTSRRRRVREGR